MAENYEISLGIGLNDSDFANIKTKIKSLEDDSVKIKLDTKDADNKIDDLKRQLQNLNKSNGNKPSLDINTVSLEKSLDRVANAIDEIKKSLNTVDGKSGMQSLLSSINQITTALGKAENETDSLVKSLSALAKKDLSLNLGINMGKSAVAQQSAYGDLARGTIIPQLKQQVKDIVQQYNTAYKTVSDAQEALLSLTQGTKIGFNLVQDVVNNRKNNLFTRMEDGSNLKQQIAALKEYITLFEQAANIKNPQLASSVSGTSQIADKLETDAKNAREGVTQLDDSLQKLKSVLNTGIDANALSVTLDPILQDLKAIREAIDNLSKGTSIDGLTASFNRLSDVLGKLDANFDKIKSSLGNELAKSVSADNAVKTAQHTGQQIGEAISDGINKNLDIDNVIDKEVKRLMKLYGVNGKDAFNDIRQSLVDYRNNGNLNEEDIFSSSGIRQVTSAIADNKSEVIALDAAYEELLKDIKAVNDSKGATKVRLSDMRSEWGDDYKDNKKILGSWFSEKYTDGIGIDSWVQGKNWSYLLDLDASHQDIANQLVDLVAKAKAQVKKVSGDELFKNGFLDMDNMESEIMASINAINAAEQKMAQSSTQSANTVVQNQQRIQQSYEDTLAKQKQRVDEIDREISDYTNRIADPTRLDPNVDPFQQIESYQNSIDTLEREKVEILANIEKIDSAFKKNENILNSFKQSLSNIGMGADEIDAVANKISNLSVQIETLNQKKSTRMIKADDGVFEKEVLDVDISGVDEYGNAIKFTQQYDMATADLIKSIEKVSTVQQKAGSVSETFIRKQKNEVANLTNQINQSYKASLSKNVNKPINKDSNIEKIKEKYIEVTAAIEKMGAASSDTFDDERNKVKALIDDFKALVKETRNLEHTSSKMKGNSVETQIAIAKQDFDKLKAEAKGYSVDFSKLDDLDISNITEKADVDKFTEALRIARAELNKLKAEVSSEKRINTAENNNKILSNKINDLKRDIENLPKIDLKINDFETEVNGAKISVESLLNSLKEVNTRSDFNAVKSNFSSFKKAAEAAGIAVTEVARKMKSVDDIKLDMELGTYDNQLSQMYDKLDRLSGASKDLRDGVEQVENAYREMNNAIKGTGDEVADRERLVQAEKEYAAYLEKTNNLIKIQARAEQSEMNAERLADKKTALQLDMANYLKDNSRAAKEFGTEINRLSASLDNLDDFASVNNVERKFKNLTKTIKNAGKDGLTVFDKLKTKAKEYMSYLSAAEMFMYAEQALRSMFEQVKLIDSAMTELKKVTDESDATYDKFLTNAASRAKDIGTTIDGLVSSTADFARLGYGFEDAQGLAEVANIYAVVGDEIEGVEGATKSLISTMAAFKDEMNGLSDSDFALSIVDKMNEVANNFSISSGGLGEALQRSASSLATGNNTLDESISLITAANEVVQNPEKVGNAMKTISMRIRSAKSEMEEMGEDTEGMVESTATLRAEIKALSGVDIMASATEFKSTYQILDEISQKWEDLSDISRATLIEKMAGKHQGNVFASLMENFDTARNALETSLNSSGSAMREHEKWQQSLESRILSLKSSWQGLSQAFLNSDFLKVALNGIIGLADGVTKLIDTFGVLPTLIGTFAGGLSLFKNQGLFKFEKDTKSIKLFGTQLTDLKGKYTQIHTAIDRYNSLSSKSASFQATYNKNLANSTSSIGKYLSGLKGANASMGGYIASLVGAKIASFALQAATMALNMALTMGISALISWGISKLDEWIETSDELAERIDEVTTKYKEQHNAMMKIKGDYNTSNEDSLISKYGELSKGVDSLGKNISLTADEYEEYRSIVSTIADQMPSLVTGYNSQGDAILSCSGSVDKLAESYRNLIKEQNSEVLKTGSDIFKDYKNDLKETTAYFRDAVKGEDGYADYIDTYNTKHFDTLKELNNLSGDELEKAVSNLSYDEYYRISQLLEERGLKRDVIGTGDWGYETYQEHIVNSIEKDKGKIKSVLAEASADLDAYAENLGSVTESYFSTAFLGGDDKYGVNDYSHLSEKLQGIITQVTSSFDSDFYTQFLNEENPYEALTKYFNDMLTAFDNLGSGEKKKLEAAFDLQAQFNGGEISYGEYVNGVKNAGKIIDSLNLDEEVESQIKLSLGLSEKDGKWVVEEYETLLNRLTSKKYEIQLDTDSAKSFLDNLNSEELNVAVKFIEEGNEDFKNALQNYKDVLDEAKQAGVDFSKTTYGNIDTNARQVLEWNGKNLKKYKDEIMSWEADDAKWDDVKKGYEDTISTVMGAWDTFEIDGKEVDIAFSPMLQTDGGAELLSSGAVVNYIEELIGKATEDGKWTNDELLKLDAEGLEVDGQKIKGILADIGDTAEATSMQMHFVGKDGALAMAEEELFAIVEAQARLNEAMNFTIAMDVETESIEAFNTAMSESVSATGLSSESIAVLKDRYSELASQGYDLSSMFEETANGIHLNREAVSEFEQKLASDKLSETEGHLTTLKGRYDELTDEIKNCTDAGERANLYSEQQQVAQKINDLATLASQYEGLTSAYNAWQNAESAGNERDMYENVLSGFETVEDELSRGWADDSTIKFLELITGRTDLAGKSAKELKEVWNGLDDTIKDTSYSVKDFFTTDKDGNSTSKGVYNFLDAVGQLEEEKFGGKDVVKRDEDGNIIEFDFKVAGGDEAIADALGISEELVQIMLRAADDAGFVVTIDGKWTQLADLKTSAEESGNALKKLRTEGLEELKEFSNEDLTFNFDASSIEELNTEFEKANNVLDKFKDKSGKIKTDKNGNMVEGAKEALEVASYYQATIDKLTEPVYMQLETNQVKESLQEPLTKMQEFERLSKEKHQLKLTGDTKELEKVEKEMNEIVDYIYENDDLKSKLEIGGLSKEEIKSKLEKGEIEIPATVDIQLEMSEDIKDMRLLMMQQLGLVSENEVKLKIGYEIDDSTVDKLDDEEKEVVVKYIEENEEVWNNLSDDKKEVYIEFIKNGNIEWFESLEDKEQEVVIKYVQKGKKLEELTEKEQEVIVKMIGDDSELKDWTAPQKEAMVKYLVDGGSVDGWTPEQKKAYAQYMVDHGDIDGWTPEKKQAWAQYLVDGGEVEGWTPEMKDAYVNYVVNGGDVEGWTPDDKKAFAKYVVDGGDPAKYQPPSKTQKVKADLDSSEPDNKQYNEKTQPVLAKLNSSAVDGYQPPEKTMTIWAQIKQKASSLWSKLTGGGGVDGTAHVNGTAFADGTVKKSGRAYKQGDWGTKDSGIALGGEEAPELLVRNGRWHLIGEKGAEFFGYRKGDIIFNASQTREIFEKGKITHGNGRGKALVSGTAFSKGTGGGFWEEETTTTTTTKKKSSGSSSGSSKSSSSSSKKPSSKSSSSSSSKSSSSSSSKASEEAEKFEETIDWIETKIARIERVIDQLDAKASNVYRSWSERNSALANQISEVGNEIDIQQKAYDRYMQEANSIGLSETYASKVRNGTIDIETITDESLKEKIDDYQKYFEVALDCKDAIEELRETESELYAQRVENVATQYEGILGVIEHEKNMIEEYISQSEANAQLISGEYYKALINNENETVSKLQEQKNKMLSELQAGMNSGTITKGSEAWYDLVNSIDEVTLSIQESNTQIKEWNQTIQQLSWETFDLLQDKISAVSEEADFLIELMSSDKLHDDKGRLTDEGSATMGLHGQNYNAYMYQSDLVAKEAERIKKQMSTDGYDTELEERYREMISLQQEYILNAQNEKEAIRDLVRDGIELELDSLQELIDKKNEELESEKDLFDYQRDVEKQTQNIASLRKRLNAYSNDTSEESKAKIQELQLELKDAEDELAQTEFDRLIENTQKITDSLYEQYSELLNTRLDNLDALVSDVIAQINMDATSISTTLSEKADSVGYTLSSSMTSIWDTNSTKINSVITTYGDKFTLAQTTTNNALSTINTNLQKMITQLNTMAKTNVKSASTSSATNNKKTDTPKQTTTTTSKPTTTTNTTKSIKVGGMVNASGAQIYDYAGDKSGERQYYRNDPKYRVLKENGNWIQVRWHKLSSGITGWFKKSDVKAYKTGAKGIDESQFAWTQEGNKAEFIVRPSDGAILTPIAKGDSVLNANASSNIWNIANSPAEFIKENLNLGGTNIPNNSNVNNNVTQNFENVIFSMPNVHSYNELLRQMQKDKNFEKLVLSMSVDRLAGKSSLAKNKVIR